MRQDRRLRQQVVVCKMAAGEPGGVEVLRLPRLAPELSCCLQDRPRRGRPAKPLRRNALGPELRCCLQDCGGGASGPGVAVVRGSGRRRRDSSAGTASSNRDCGSAISWDCRGKRRGIRDRQRVYGGDNRRGDGAGSRPRRIRPGGAGTSKAGRAADSKDNTVHPYEWRCLTHATAPPGASEFRNCCKVFTASPPMVSLPELHHRGKCGRSKPGMTKRRRQSD
jgi:hypothetical protein